MAGPPWRPSAAALARARALASRQLTPAEYEAAARIPLGPEERAATRELVRWFTTRYPTPAERLAYARRLYRRLAGRSRGSR